MNRLMRHLQIVLLEFTLGVAPMVILIRSYGYTNQFPEAFKNYLPSDPIAKWYLLIGLIGFTFISLDKFTTILDFFGKRKQMALRIFTEFTGALKSLYLCMAGISGSIVFLGLWYEPFSLRLLIMIIVLVIFYYGCHYVAFITDLEPRSGVKREP